MIRTVALPHDYHRQRHVLATTPRLAHRNILNAFRIGVYASLTRRIDVLFELADAGACSLSRVTDVAHLSLEAEQERGHGGVYDGLNAGRIDTDRLRSALAGTPLPKVTGPDGRKGLVLAWTCRTGCAPMPPPARTARSAKPTHVGEVGPI